MLKTLLLSISIFFFNYSNANLALANSDNFFKFKEQFDNGSKLFNSPQGLSSRLGTNISRYKGICINSKHESYAMFIEIYPENTLLLEEPLKNLSFEVNYAYSESELENKSQMVLSGNKLPYWVEPIASDFYNSPKDDYKPFYTGDAYFAFEVINQLIYGKAVVRQNKANQLSLKLMIPNSDIVHDFAAYCSLEKDQKQIIYSPTSLLSATSMLSIP